MSQLNEADAEKLSPEQATGLIRVLELQARWENHRDDPEKSAATASDLQVRQKGFDAFKVAWNAYAAQYRSSRLPEPTQNMPDRLGIWCRALRAVFLRGANAEYPAQVMAKVYRVAARTAARTGAQPIAIESGKDLAGAIRELDTVITWCGSLMQSGPAVRLANSPKENAA